MLVRYWAIAPSRYSPKASFERIWRYDRDNEIITIGWDVGKPTSLRDLKAWYSMYWPDETEHGLKMLAMFWFEIRPGDGIIARAGRKRIAGVGIVRGEPYYDKNIGEFAYGSNILPVHWDSVEEKVFRELVFPMHTITELKESRFEQLTRRR